VELAAAAIGAFFYAIVLRIESRQKEDYNQIHRKMLSPLAGTGQENPPARS